MVTDSIANAAQYFGLGKGIEIALKYLGSRDFGAVEPGQYHIEGTDCYVIVLRCDTKPREEGIWEAHRKFIDVQ